MWGNEDDEEEEKGPAEALRRFLFIAVMTVETWISAAEAAAGGFVIAMEETERKE